MEAKRKRMRVENFEHGNLQKDIERIWQHEKQFFMKQVTTHGYTWYEFDIQLKYHEFIPCIDDIVQALPRELADLYKTDQEKRHGGNQDGIVTLQEILTSASIIGRKWKVEISFEAPLARRWVDEALDSGTSLRGRWPSGVIMQVGVGGGGGGGGCVCVCVCVS